MCGIAGLMSTSEKKIDLKVLDNMLEKIEHRGPDDSGVFGLSYELRGMSVNAAQEFMTDDVFLGMGFNRLSIRDVSINGHQPMLSDDEKLIITFNGEIYNTEYIKSSLGLKKDRFKGNSDTEVILRAYEKIGENIFYMLNGMFAIVLLDLHRNKLLIVRDKIGIIPIYLLEEDRIIAWASEEKSFLAIPEFKREINIEALSKAYIYYNPSELLHKKIKNVQPGTIISIDILNNTITEKKYFDINEWLINKPFKSKDDALEEYEAILKDCVERQMVSDVPLGLQLSGGIDSTSIAYWADKICDNRVKTFSTINSLNEEFNEEKWIKHVVDKTNVDASFIPIGGDFFSKYYEKTLYAFEKLLGVQDGMSIFCFSQSATESTTVLLSGEGADEICGGYGMVQQVLNPTFSFTDELFIQFDKQLDCLENGMAMLNDFSISDIRKEREEYLSCISGDNRHKMEALWLKEELVNLLERQNKINMANSIENRVPLLDDEMVKFMMSLPIECIIGNVKDYGLQTKLIMKRASEKYFGKKFAYRPKQSCRYRISDQILAKEFQEYLNDLIIPGMTQRGIINMKEFYRKYNKMQTGQDVLSVWKAINIETWCQLFVDGRYICC